MCSVKTCDKEYLNFTSINNDELVSNWWALDDKERDSYGCKEKAFTHYLSSEFNKFQNGETKYK